MPAFYPSPVVECVIRPAAASGRELASAEPGLEEIQSSFNASANETAAAVCFIL